MADALRADDGKIGLMTDARSEFCPPFGREHPEEYVLERIHRAVTKPDHGLDCVDLAATHGNGTDHILALGHATRIADSEQVGTGPTPTPAMIISTPRLKLAMAVSIPPTIWGRSC